MNVIVQFFLRHTLVASVVMITLMNTMRADAALYAATATGAAGHLYLLDPATGAMLQDIGSLDDANSVNYPMTGLAFHPITGVLYGSTGNSQSSTAALLVTINPATGLVTVVGPFNTGVSNTSGTPATMGDIEFDSAGNLYGVSTIGGPQLYSINITTGQATLVGSTGLTSTSGGGLGISPAGVFYGTPTSSRFGTYNSATGAYANIANPAKPAGTGAYGALSFDGNVLYGLNVGPGSPPPTHLVTMTTAGVVTDIGASLSSLDAIAFTPPPPSLSIAKSTNNLVVSWPAVPGFRLESNTNLTTASWSTNTPAPVLSGNTNSVNITPSTAATFYRLQKP